MTQECSGSKSGNSALIAWALLSSSMVCVICAGSVRFLLQHEVKPELVFAPTQSATGKRLLHVLGFDPEDVRTFVLIEGAQAYVRSEALVRVAGYLRWPWRVFAAFRFMPRPMCDWAYDMVATHRYHLFGRSDSCMVPTPELRARFIQD